MNLYTQYMYDIVLRTEFVYNFLKFEISSTIEILNVNKVKRKQLVIY